MAELLAKFGASVLVTVLAVAGMVILLWIACALPRLSRIMVLAVLIFGGAPLIVGILLAMWLDVARLIG
jgi:hypothetical protein